MSAPNVAQEIGLRRGPIDKNPTPKTVFRESTDNIKAHNELTQSRPFTRAIDFALLEYQRELANECLKDMGKSAFVGLKMTGAQEFVRTLRGLADIQVSPPVIVDPDNLNHG
jgi:hypothetical protein